MTLTIPDRDVDNEFKLLCLKAPERFGYITAEEATQLFMYRTNLERMTDL